VTLVETLALVIVIAVAAPPLVMAATSGARASADSRARAQALALASAALETVIADAASGRPELGLEAMGDANYLDEPMTGLHARLERVSAGADAVGASVEVSFGEPVDARGDGVDVTDPEATRLVTAIASYPTSRGTARLVLRTVVGRP
jgi:type II secretory pathway pseudopilin PulG